jgi:Phage integrase family
VRTDTGTWRGTSFPAAQDLVRDSALVLSNLDGTHRHPERFSRRFAGQVVQARKALWEEQLPVIRLHDLRHTHATLLLADGVPVKVVSARLGHASATITLTVHQHVHPGMGRQAADRFAALLEGRSEARSITRVSRGPDRPRQQNTSAPDLQEHRGEVVSEGRHATYAHARSRIRRRPHGVVPN